MSPIYAIRFYPSCMYARRLVAPVRVSVPVALLHRTVRMRRVPDVCLVPLLACLLPLCCLLLVRFLCRRVRSLYADCARQHAISLFVLLLRHAKFTFRLRNSARCAERARCPSLPLFSLPLRQTCDNVQTRFTYVFVVSTRREGSSSSSHSSESIASPSPGSRRQRGPGKRNSRPSHWGLLPKEALAVGMRLLSRLSAGYDDLRCEI